ncbi:MAG: nitrate transporter, inner rane subunit, partial [Rhodospirillales bacterium]|nr:nitrate transporter, inner rane subunit [Rhodospirillales bacterium]
MAAASKATALAGTADMPVPEAPARSAEIVAFQPPMRPVLERVGEIGRHTANVVLPPLIVLAITLFVWQLLCSEPGARLPPPTKVVSDAWDFIIDPFYDNGGVDKGAFWQ